MNEHLGLSIRFIRHFDIEPDRTPKEFHCVPESEASRYVKDPIRCFMASCTDPTPLKLADAVWLADDTDTAYPFHPECAEGPWPMYPVRPPK